VQYYQLLQNANTIFNDAGNGMVLISNKLIRGNFSIYYKLTGGGTINFEYFLSPDDAAVVPPSSPADFIPGVVTPGEAFTGFIPVLSPWLGIRAIEQNVGPVNFEKLAVFFH